MRRSGAFLVSVKGIPQEDIDTALKVLLRSFNVISLSMRKRGGDIE